MLKRASYTSQRFFRCYATTTSPKTAATVSATATATENVEILTKSAVTVPPKIVGFVERPDPHEITCDYIGPPDPKSNLRPYVRFIAKDETPLARRFRLKQIEVEEWNMDFWTKHNKRFYEEKEEFIRLLKQAGIEDISADRMSIFYKNFLDRNLRMHMLYNLSWYIKNFNLLVLALQVEIQNLYKRLLRARFKRIEDTSKNATANTNTSANEQETKA